MSAVASPRFLIVDDRPFEFKVVAARDVIQAVYEGSVVETAQDQQAALLMVSQRDFFCIFMDYNLEDDVKGPAVIDALRRAGVKTEIVAFSTELERDEVCSQFRAAGANAGVVPGHLLPYLKAKKEGRDVAEYDSLRAQQERDASGHLRC